MKWIRSSRVKGRVLVPWVPDDGDDHAVEERSRRAGSRRGDRSSRGRTSPGIRRSIQTCPTTVMRVPPYARSDSTSSGSSGAGLAGVRLQHRAARGREQRGQVEGEDGWSVRAAFDRADRAAPGRRSLRRQSRPQACVGRPGAGSCSGQRTGAGPHSRAAPRAPHCRAHRRRPSPPPARGPRTRARRCPRTAPAPVRPSHRRGSRRAPRGRGRRSAGWPGPAEPPAVHPSARRPRSASAHGT